MCESEFVYVYVYVCVRSKVDEPPLAAEIRRQQS